MKIAKSFLIIIAAFTIGGVCTWILRGEYDKHLMMEGHFHIISTASQHHDVILKFPSGEQVDFNLKKGGSHNFNLTNTGEGSIAVAINGKDRDQIGYVTSMNSIVVLAIGDKQTEFSQIFPSLITEQIDTRVADKRRP
jgi:hypothetical protein